MRGVSCVRFGHCCGVAVFSTVLISEADRAQLTLGRVHLWYERNSQRALEFMSFVDVALTPSSPSSPSTPCATPSTACAPCTSRRR